MKLSEFIKSTGKYDLTIFSQEAIGRIENAIFEKNDKYFLKCLTRNKDIQVKSEEIVRQLILDKLMNEHNYSLELMAKDRLVEERKSLKKLIEEIEEEVFIAVSKNSGKEIYEVHELGKRKPNKYNHLIQKCDLKEITNELESW